MDTKQEQSDQDDEDAEMFLRSVTWAEEDRHLYTSMPWRGERRWFRTQNVTCIEKVRSARKKQGTDDAA